MQGLAKLHNFHAVSKAIRYEFVYPEVLAGTAPALRKNSLHMLTPDEVHTVKVIFSKQKCLACGQQGDPRLMDDKCHWKPVEGQNGTLEQRFTRKEVKVTKVVGTVSTIGLIGAAR